MTSTPLPTKIVFLHELSDTAVNTKVRFLGCVTRYHVPSGILTLKHHFPVESRKPAKAFVDLNLCLESVKSTDIQIGSWINVLGYVRMSEHGHSKKSNSDGDAKGETKEWKSVLLVQATLILSAGSIDVGNYERVLTLRRNAENPKVV